MPLPLLLLEHRRRVKLVRVVLLAEGPVARDDLVEGEDGEFDVVAVLVVGERAPVALVRLAVAAQLGGEVEIEYLEVVG